MRWTGALAAAALVVGCAAGVALSVARAEPAPETASPLPAEAPSVPGDPPPALRPDTDSPALEAGLPYERDTLGPGDEAVRLRVPAGWRRIDLGPGEAKWVVPGNRLNTFVLRVELLRGDRTVEEVKARRIAELERITQDFRLVHETETGMRFVYVENDLRRYGNLRWIEDPDGGRAAVEVAAHGRRRDQPGLADLLTRVANGTEAGLR